MSTSGVVPGGRMLAAVSHELHRRGFVANHDGNASLQQSDGIRFFATPTATSKRLVSEADIITVDITGKVLAGRKKLFGEWHLHAACYKARSDVRAVLHAHPPHATAWGLLGKALPALLPEQVVSLGDGVPVVGFALPKSKAQDDAIARALTTGDADALLIAGNGVVSVGVDMEQALLRMELVEHIAHIAILAHSVGGATPLRADDVQSLLAARTKAGLGRAGRDAARDAAR
jgi:L-fuculose-phosphate aldolase